MSCFSCAAEGKHSGDGQFKTPSGFALDSAGALLNVWDAGSLLQPSGITLDANDTIYVADSANCRIVKMSTTGTVLAAWGSSQIFNYPADIAVHGAGLIYGASSGSSAILTTPLQTGVPPAAAMLLLLGE